jgi:PBP1b-binding outer membrane lipoprotein LpoB
MQKYKNLRDGLKVVCVNEYYIQIIILGNRNMKRLSYLLILLSILASCTGNEGDQDASNNRPLDQSAALLHQFKPVINGVWVKKNYIRKLVKSKSPLAAAERAKGITTMFIDTAKLKGDSIVVPAGWNNQKASNVILRFQPGRNTTTVMLGDDELSYTIKNGDTTLVIYHYNPDTKETTSDKYIKAFNKQQSTDVHYAMNYMINKGIISGKYDGTDNAGHKISAAFTDDGKVTGLPGFNTYLVQNYQAADARNATDNIIFNLNQSNQTVYSFSINKRNLSLYQASANNASGQNRGLLKYQLTKKR